MIFYGQNGRKVICGTQSGALLLYSWGHFKDCSDRFIDLSPNSVDALLKLDEDSVITGSENGLISLVGILPNRIIQPIAEHSEYPVERLAFSFDRKYLGSISHDQMLKLWDLDDLLQGSGSTLRSREAMADNDSDEMDVDAKVRIEGSAEVVVLFQVKVVGLHQLLLLGLESALEVPLERRFFGGSEEKGIGAGKVERGHEEADGLHHIPTQFPEGEPHEAQCLENQESPARSRVLLGPESWLFGRLRSSASPSALVLFLGHSGGY
ncbi:WD repeat-containing protein 55 [Vitis vinifera]|uniref:WD repeat-containing protein 55 n=1 Tax=Vitis vinifera TaxID=29760 RepID=A0A438CYM0_VITVI|nr:WD repeat-containing protein 55 [Vitis vinifera]